MPQAPASRAAATTRSIWLGWSERPGRSGGHPHRGVHACLDESRERSQPLARRRSAGLGRPPDIQVDRRHRERDVHLGDRRSSGEQCCVANDQRPTRDDRERIRRVPQHLDTRARQMETALRGLVGIGRGADRDLPSVPPGAGELAAQHVGDVRLDSDRGAVPVVRRTVCSLLEGADVTERAAVHATHVRIQGPFEGHPAHPVESDAARLLAIFDSHFPI